MAKQRYDNRVNVKPFKPGDWVYLWRPRKKGQHAFASNFYGPFKILSKVGDYVYKIDPGNSRIHAIVPHDLLRLEPSGENVAPREFDPPEELEWDHGYQFPNIETNRPGHLLNSINKRPKFNNFTRICQRRRSLNYYHSNHTVLP
jgi:hypothetical protein